MKIGRSRLRRGRLRLGGRRDDDDDDDDADDDETIALTCSGDGSRSQRRIQEFEKGPSPSLLFPFLPFPFLPSRSPPIPIPL